MTHSTPKSFDPLVALFEEYLNGTLDEAGIQTLENRLLTDSAARECFVRYARMHADLTLELRARRAAEVAIESLQPAPTPARRFPARRSVAAIALIAGVLLAVGLGWKLLTPTPQTVAWLVNAQNCSWTDGDPPADLRPGRILRMDSGLAEVQFRSGARLVIEGPARLEFLSAGSARLHLGKIAARVPPEATGFEVFCPHGKVIDLGTEFGVSVADGGAAEVYVFEGRVDAYPAVGQAGEKVNLVKNQGARLSGGTVTTNPADPSQFTRSIVPTSTTVPVTRRLAFDRTVDGSLQDSLGRGTGLTHRLPGTGSWIDPHDANLRLVPEAGRLELTTTNSDLNTRYRLNRGEYLGFRLKDMGFTGAEDFEVAATFPSLPALAGLGQLGLYVGSKCDRCIRGGVLIAGKIEGQYHQFLVNNTNGKDTDTYRVGLNEAGTSLRMVLRRIAGKYTLLVENQTVGFSNTLAIRHPDFLDGETDLYVGLFGANTQSDVQRTVAVTDFQATVWTPTPDKR